MDFKGTYRSLRVLVCNTLTDSYTIKMAKVYTGAASKYSLHDKIKVGIKILNDILGGKQSGKIYTAV